MAYDEEMLPGIVRSGVAFVIMFACLFAFFGSAIVVYYYYVVCPGWREFHIKREKHLRNAKNWILRRKHVKARSEDDFDLEMNNPCQPSTRQSFNFEDDSDAIFDLLWDTGRPMKNQCADPGPSRLAAIHPPFTGVNHHDGQLQQPTGPELAYRASTGDFSSAGRDAATMPTIPAPTADITAPPIKKAKKQKAKEEKVKKEKAPNKGVVAIPAVEEVTPATVKLQAGVYTEDMLAQIEQRAAQMNRVPLSPGDPVMSVEQRVAMRPR